MQIIYFIRDRFGWQDYFLLEKVAISCQGLYPNLCRELIKASISNDLQKCTKYTKEIRKILIDLTIFCLENIVVKNGNSPSTNNPKEL